MSTDEMSNLDADNLKEPTDRGHQALDFFCQLLGSLGKRTRVSEGVFLPARSLAGKSPRPRMFFCQRVRCQNLKEVPGHCREVPAFDE